jgi:hypothetical protein
VITQMMWVADGAAAPVDWDLDLSAMSYAGSSNLNESVGGTSFHITSDGLNMITTHDSRWILQFSLGTAWDLKTARYARKRFDVRSLFPTATLVDAAISDDLDKVIIRRAATTDAVWQLNLSTAGDITTCTDSGNGFGTGSFTANHVSVTIGGTQVIVTRTLSGSGSFAAYNLLTPWTLGIGSSPNSTASKNIGSFVWAPTGSVAGHNFETAISGTDTAVRLITFGTPGDLSTRTLGGVKLTVPFSQTNGARIRNAQWIMPGNIWLTLGQHEIHYWDVSTAYDPAFAVADATKNLNFRMGESNNTAACAFGAGGSELLIARPGTNAPTGVTSFDLDSPHDALTAVPNYRVLRTETGANPCSLYVSEDGSRAFVGNVNDRKIYAYDLSVPWDLDSAALDAGNELLVAGAGTLGRSLAFNPAGTRCYAAISTAPATIKQFNLGTAWDLTTASEVATLDVSARDTSPGGIVFNPAGTSLFMACSVNRKIVKFSMSTPFDLSTASFAQEFSYIAVANVVAHGLAIADDGESVCLVSNANTAYQFVVP